MDETKITEALDLYDELLPELNQALPTVQYLRHGAIPATRAMVACGQVTTAMFGVGFVQGALLALGVYSVDQLTSHLRAA